MDIKSCTHFQHDGAPCHQTKAVKKWFENNGVEILGPWSGNSPDLNPIENYWVILIQNFILNKTAHSGSRPSMHNIQHIMHQM